MRNTNGQWSFIDILTLLDTILQVADFDMNMRQSSNEDIMQEIQRQNTEYLERIISDQKEILKRLADKG